MIIKLKKLSVSLLAAMLVVGINGCEKGPAENAGEAIDEAIEDAGDAIEDAGDAIEDAVEEQQE
jgi:hypothetical protein